MNRLIDTYYIGSIKCDTNNAMMQEIAELMKGYEYSLLHAQPKDLFGKLNTEIDAICNKHNRCANIKLQMAEHIPDCGCSIYACKPGSDHCVLCIPVHAVLNEIVL